MTSYRMQLLPLAISTRRTAYQDIPRFGWCIIIRAPVSIKFRERDKAKWNEEHAPRGQNSLSVNLIWTSDP